MPPPHPGTPPGTTWAKEGNWIPNPGPEDMWSDLRTTYRLLPVGNRPHEAVEVLVGGRPEVEVPHGRLDHPGVGLGKTLVVCFNGKLAGNVLPQKTQYIRLFRGDWSQIPVGRHHDSQRARTTRGHVTAPGGGMLGNFQQNSRILILCIYSLSNICNN